MVKMCPTYEVQAMRAIKDEFFRGSAVIVDGAIFLGGRNKLYAITHLSRFGHRNWTHEAEVFRFRPLKAQNGL